MKIQFIKYLLSPKCIRAKCQATFLSVLALSIQSVLREMGGEPGHGEGSAGRQEARETVLGKEARPGCRSLASGPRWLQVWSSPNFSLKHQKIYVPQHYKPYGLCHNYSALPL